MNLFVEISVYPRSRYKRVGQAMSLAKFMAMGKDYVPQIMAYRKRKQEFTELKLHLQDAKNKVKEFEPIVAAGYNPLLDEEPQEYTEACVALSESKALVEIMTPQVDALKKECESMKKDLPGATLSGLFHPTRAKENLVHHSGFICVDIDDHVNVRNSSGEVVVVEQSLDNLFDVLSELPWVVYAAHSVGGQGYFVLIPIGSVDAEHPHEWYFECLEQEFLQYGYIIDPACSDVSRLRFLSYDEHPYRNPRAVSYMGRANFIGRAERERIAEEERLRHEREEHYARLNGNNPDRDLHVTERLVSEIERRSFDITGSYDQCIKIGRSLYSLGSSGLFLWKRICRLRSASHSQMRTDHELEVKWKSFKGSSAPVGWFWHLCADAGIRVYKKQ